MNNKTANLEDFLASLGLFKHKESFEEQEVDLNMMIEMDEEDVKECLKAVKVHRYGERNMIIQKIRDMKDEHKGGAKTAPIIKEGRQFEDDTQSICTICYEQYKSPMELKEHMLIHNSSKSDAPTKPAKTEECNLCVEIKTQARPMHICRYCRTGVCNLSCSKQDPNFPEDEMRRVHRKGKGCRAENPPDELKVTCPKCQKLFRGIDFKAHLKLKHYSNSSAIKCFECQYEAENIADFKVHVKQHYSNNKEVQHEKCNLCSKVFRNKAELKLHIESVHHKECDICSKKLRNQLELRKHVDSVHVFEGDESSLEDLRIVQKPEIMSRIKQNIKIADLEYDSDEDEDFEKQLEKNEITPPHPRYITSRKCKETKGMDEELLQEDSVYLTPPPVTPQKQNPPKKSLKLFHLL